jgi:hypothetical protein
VEMRCALWRVEEKSERAPSAIKNLTRDMCKFVRAQIHDCLIRNFGLLSGKWLRRETFRM